MDNVKKLISRLLSSTRHPLSREGGFLILSQYGTAAAGLATTVVAARALGTTGYGQAAVIVAVPLLVWAFLDLKPASVLVRHLSLSAGADRWEEFAGYAGLGYSVAAAAGLVALAVVSAASTWLVPSLSPLPEAPVLTMWLAAKLPFRAVGAISSGMLVSLRRTRYAGSAQLAEKTLVLGFVLFASRGGLDVSTFLLATVAGEIVGALLTTAIAFKVLASMASELRWRAFRAIPSAANLLQDLRWNYLFVCMSGILFQVPLIVLGSRRDTDDAAFLKLSLSLITAVAYIESGLWKVVNPLLSRRMFTEGSHRLIAVMRRWTVRAGLPLGLSVAIVAAFVPLAISSLFGQDYAGMQSGLRWMLLGAAVSVIFFVLNPAYFAMGGVRPWVMGYSMYALATVVLGMWAASSEGFTGFAAVFACATGLFNLAMAILAPRHLNRPDSANEAAGEVVDAVSDPRRPNGLP